ncbi:MAG: hypothetical protein WC325_04295, partial [Candidatus Bathyarchaeia archaeon]
MNVGVDLEDGKTWKMYRLYEGHNPRMLGRIIQILDFSGTKLDCINRDYEFEVGCIPLYGVNNEINDIRFLYLPIDFVRGYRVTENMAVELILNSYTIEFGGERVENKLFEKLIDGPIDVIPENEKTVISADKKYYHQRMGREPEKISFEMLKKIFLLIFKKLEKEFYFQEAMGYKCGDKAIPGIWGDDPESFIFLKTHLVNVWPIPEKMENFDEPKLFSVIELLYEYVSESEYKYFHDECQCEHSADSFNFRKGKKRYQQEINTVLKQYKSGYELSDSGKILSLLPDGFEKLIAGIEKTDDPKNFDDRISCAMTTFRKYDATIEEKKSAIIELGNVLEFLKNDGIRFQTKDASDLFNILN